MNRFSRLLALLMSLCLMVSLLASCGGNTDSGGSTADAGKDTFTVALDSDIVKLDPAFAYDFTTNPVVNQITQGLLTFDEDNQLQPMLASSWEQKDDLTYVYQIRDDVTFSDGSAMTMDDVLYSMNRIKDPATASYLSWMYDNVASIEQTGDWELTVTLSTPDATWQYVPATTAGHVISKAYAEQVGDKLGTPEGGLVGTGPYKFVDWTKGASVTLVANDEYWGEAPKVKNLVFKIIAEGNTRLTSLMNGECDIISSVDPSSADQVTSNGFELFSEDGMTINYMAFNTETGQCTDQEVRKAVAQAINVEEMVQAIYGDYATVANSVMPTWMAPYAKDVKQTAYDPEAAKKTLADKGITSLQCITYTTARPYNQKGGSQLANMIQGYLSEVGVDVSITEYDWTTYKTKVQTDPYDICFYGWTGDNGDPDNFMNLLADTNWSMNVAHFQDDEYKALIAQGVDTPDGDERDAIYLKCEEMVAEKQPWVLISHSKNLLGINPKVKDFYYHPTGVAFFKGVSKEA